MPHYEYKVVAAPTKGLKARGVKTPEARFANSVESLLNTLGAEGWEYLRAELLPSEERSGLTGSTTNWRNVLVFRRSVATDADLFQPRVLDEAKTAPEERPEPPIESEQVYAGETDQEPEPQPTPGDTDVPESILQFTNMTGRAARHGNDEPSNSDTPKTDEVPKN